MMSLSKWFRVLRPEVQKRIKDADEATDFEADSKTEYPPKATIFIRKIIPETRGDFERKSFIGGLPLMPDDLDWPHRKCWEHEEPQPSLEHIPMHFVCQIDFQDIHDFSGRDLLPKDGILYLFYGADIDGCFVDQSTKNKFWKFLYSSNGSTRLERRQHPTNLRPMIMGRKGKTTYGYFPINFTFGETEPEANFKDNGRNPHQHYLAAKRTWLEKAFGYVAAESIKKNIDGKTLIPNGFPPTVRHATCYFNYLLEELKREEIQTLEFIKHFEEGLRDDHPSYKDRPSAKPKSPEEWSQQYARHKLLLSDSEAKQIKISRLKSTLKQLAPNKTPTPKISKETADVANEMSTRFWHSMAASQKEARESLLQQFSTSEIDFSPADLLALDLAIRQPEFNDNQMLGYWEGRSHASDMQLLLQLDTCHAGTGMQWADGGKAYFYISPSDLAARRFDSVLHYLN